MSDFLQEYRCKCGKLLFKGYLEKCKIEVKCKRCGEIKFVDFGNEISKENKTHNFDVDKREC